MYCTALGYSHGDFYLGTSLSATCSFLFKNSVLQTTSGIFASGGVVANCEQKHYSPRYVFEHENFVA